MSPARRSTLFLVLATFLATPALAEWPPGGAILLDLPDGSTHSKPLRYDVTDDGNGGLFAVWDTNEMQRMTASGSVAPGWPSSGLGVMAHNGPSRIVGDGVGGVYVSAFGGPVTISRVTAAGTPAAGWPENGIPLSVAGTAVRAPLMASDGTGGAFLAWWEQPVGESSRIVLQRVSPSGAAVAAAPLVLLASAGYAMPVGMVADGVGGVFVVLATQYATGQDDLYAQHVNHDLQTLWAAGGVVVSTHGGAQMNPALTPDGSGGVYVAWGDSRYDLSYPYDLRAIVTRLDASGARAVGWPEAGVHAGLTDTGMELSPQILRNADGSIFVGWRSVSPGPIAYLQRILGSGAFAAGWPAAGRPITTALNPSGNVGELESYAVESAPGGSNGPSGFGLMSDGSGGVFATWQSGDGIVVQRVDFSAAAVAGWSPEGITIATPHDNGYRFWYPEKPGIVTDGFGGAIVTWRDRAYVPKYEWDQEIRAAHVLGGGTVVGLGDAPGAVATSLSLAPNPSAGEFRAAVTLADAAPARLELFDLQGRRLESHALAGRGRHVIGFGQALPLASGVYLVRLVTPGRAFTARAAVVR